ncbi:MAG: 30S ribosomal protein S11 [Armatimonadota bacterium]
MARKQTTRGKAKEKRQVAHGHVHIQATFNNTIITITDASGNTLCWASSGHVGFKGSRKGTPFAAQLAAESAAKKARDHGMETVEVFVSGPGSGRETAIRSINNNGLAVQSIRDVTAVPHNGCRPPKAPRN